MCPVLSVFPRADRLDGKDRDHREQGCLAKRRKSRLGVDDSKQYWQPSLGLMTRLILMFLALFLFLVKKFHQQAVMALTHWSASQTFLAFANR